jgi:hypothetical protein
VYRLDLLLCGHLAGRDARDSRHKLCAPAKYGDKQDAVASHQFGRLEQRPIRSGSYNSHMHDYPVLQYSNSQSGAIR